MSTTLAAPDSPEEQASVWKGVATGLQADLNDAMVSASRWTGYAFGLEAKGEADEAAIAALTEENAELRRRLSAFEREVKALRWTNSAQERTIQRQLEVIQDLRKRLPPTEQHEVTPAEAFRATHPIADVIGTVVDLQPSTDGPREYLVGRCPFHEDNHPSPSLVVRPWFAQFACQVCGAHGDVVDFLKLYEAGRAA